MRKYIRYSIVILFIVSLSLTAHAQMTDHLEYVAFTQQHISGYEAIKTANIVQVVDNPSLPLVKRDLFYNRETAQCISREEPVNSKVLVDPSTLGVGQPFRSSEMKTVRLLSQGQFQIYSEGMKSSFIRQLKDQNLTRNDFSPFYGLVPKHILEEGPVKVSSSSRMENGKNVVAYDLAMNYDIHYRIKCDPNVSYKLLELEQTKGGVTVRKLVASDYTMANGVYYPQLYTDTRYGKDGTISYESTNMTLFAEFNKSIPEDAFELNLPVGTKVEKDNAIESARRRAFLD